MFLFCVRDMVKGEDGRLAVVLESTIFHPQGGGQPSDIGFISVPEFDFKFIVEDVRSKDGLLVRFIQLDR